MPDGARLLTLEWEPLSGLLDDGLEALVAEHHAEVGVHKDTMPLAVDYDRYQLLEDQDILHCLAARRGETLIGYNIFLVLPHIRYARTLTASCEAIFVTQRHRKGGAGIRLIDTAEADLKLWAKPDYCRIVYHDRAGVELLGPVLKRRGYALRDLVYDKMARL